MKIMDLVRDATCPDEDRHWLAPCFGGTVAAAMLWLAFDRYQQLKHPDHLFAPISLSLSSLVIAVTIGTALGAVGGWTERIWRRRHAEAARKVAQQIGFEFFPAAEALKHLSNQFRLLKHWSRSEWLMSGEIDGVPVNVFDVTTLFWDIDGGHGLHSTVVVLPATGVPDFLIVPRSRLLPKKWSGIGLGNDEQTPARDSEANEAFSEQFVVHPDYNARADDLTPPKPDPESENEVRQFFTPELMKSLLPFSDCFIESRKDNLVISRGRGFRPPVEREKLLTDAVAIRAILMPPPNHE